MQAVSEARVAENRVYSLAEGRNDKVGPPAQALLITALNKDCPATGCTRTIHVPPPITNNVTRTEIDF